MAARRRILALMLVLCVNLPLLASANLLNFDLDTPLLKVHHGHHGGDDSGDSNSNSDGSGDGGDSNSDGSGNNGDSNSNSDGSGDNGDSNSNSDGSGDNGDSNSNTPTVSLAGYGGPGGGGGTGKKKPPRKQEPPQQEPVKPVHGPVPGALQVGFYQHTCPQAETIVQETTKKIFERNVRIAPSLVRLYFHDCFVTGCDGSILLEKTPSGEKTERLAEQNGPFVRGFAEVEEVKSALEAACPGIVSCADVLAFATRDALVETGLPSYPVAAGRRDRPESLAKNVAGNLPYPDSTAKDMIGMFTKKGMTLEDLVVLIGSHSTGEAHCRVISERFGDPEKRKDVNPKYLDQLHVHLLCVDPEQKLPFDMMSQNIMDSGYYNQILANETLIESDQNLVKEPNANEIMKRYANDQEGWAARFTQAITRLGEVEVLTGNQGEIRKHCSAVN